MKFGVMMLAAFCAAFACRAEDPTLATVTVVFDDGQWNCWTNIQVVAAPKIGYSTNDVAYIGTVTAIRPDAVTEWQAILQKVEVLWEDYEQRMERRKKIEQRRKEPTRKSKVNKWAQELRQKYKEAK